MLWSGGACPAVSRVACIVNAYIGRKAERDGGKICGMQFKVMTGREETVRDMCKRLIDRKQYNDIFVIRFDKAKRYYGTWHKEKRNYVSGIYIY